MREIWEKGVARQRVEWVAAVFPPKADLPMADRLRGRGDILDAILNEVKNLICHELQILRLPPQNDTALGLGRFLLIICHKCDQARGSPALGPQPRSGKIPQNTD